MIHWELCKKLKSDHTNKWYLHNTESVCENDKHKFLWDFRDTNRSPNLGQTTRKRKKRDKYYDLVRELKKLWNMKVTFIPIVIGALGTVTKGLVKGLEDLEIRGLVVTIQSTALLG